MIVFLRYVVIIMGLLLVAPLSIAAEKNILNIYTWASEIPFPVVKQFEKETGIRVNYASYDSNEVLYAKLRANNGVGYDIIEPSSYYVEKMRHQHMLEKLDKNKLPNFKNIDPFFSKQPYDPDSNYSIPFIWGATGMFINKNYYAENSALQWEDFLNKKYLNQLILLDDAREVFSMMLRMLGYSINDKNPEHIKQAYLRLRELIPNVHIFSSDAVISILIDEDSPAGMAWNGDVFNAQKENGSLQFIFPKNGFEIWVDNFALLRNAPHRENAYRFLNFLMRPDIAKEISLNISYSTTNLVAQQLMPPEVKNNSTLYPSHAVLSRGEFESDIGDDTAALLEKYWERFKMEG